ncbi:MAG TPA: hypothetical protein VEC19_04470 [Usitatibacter sp.]|nr:hypothetical protein [Usitatibacter sp.]
MKIRTTHLERRAAWRQRFIEIARQVEGARAPAAVVAAGLRARMRSTGLAGLRRSRTA